MGPSDRGGLLRIATPAETTRDAAAQPNVIPELTLNEQTESQLAAHVRSQFEMMKRHRESDNGWNDRLINALRMFNGQYDPRTLSEIRQFGGSEIYARLVAVKCRGATALLRDIYLNTQRPWALLPTPNPSMPDDVIANVDSLIAAESASAALSGAPPDEEEIARRRRALVMEAERAQKRAAAEEATRAQERLDDILVEGGFYKALAEFLTDLPLFPFACIKGPVVRNTLAVSWVGPPGNKTAETTVKPKMFWHRVSPFDLWWTPGVSDIAQANIIERSRLTRADLNALIGVPGYNEEALRNALRDYGKTGHTETSFGVDQEQADLENRESPTSNESGVIDMLEFTGSVQGSMLLDYGMSKKQVPDPDTDYTVQIWMVGRYVIKVQMLPSPRKRHPYYITSFEKAPGTVLGNALPDILSDVQDVANASLRALVNNLAMSSGPQVVVDLDRLAAIEDAETLYPWKRWRVRTDPTRPPRAGEPPPVDFFQPSSNAQVLLGVYEKFTQMADELSAIPRYITGSERLGGAGRTASGLAMLMNNATKILQTVAANIDSDIVEPVLASLYDMVMLTDKGKTLRGDETIEVRGVNVAIQKETERQRQVEILQATANPLDVSIMGLRGRGALLRKVMEHVGLGDYELVPSDDELRARDEAARNQAAPPGAPGAPGGPPEGAPGGPPEGAPPENSPENPPENPREAARIAQGMQRGGDGTGPRDRGPRVNLQQQVPMM
jgi:hypothetical protein